MGVSSLPKTVTRQRRDCDLNPGPSAPESSTLTTRLPSHAIFKGVNWALLLSCVEMAAMASVGRVVLLSLVCLLVSSVTARRRHRYRGIVPHIDDSSYDSDSDDSDYHQQHWSVYIG